MKIVTFQEGVLLPALNGISVHTRNYLRALSSAGHDITVITNYRDSPRLDLYQKESWTSLFLPLKRYYNDRSLVFDLLRQVKPDLIHSNVPEHILNLVAPVAFSLQCPILFESFNLPNTDALLQAAKLAASTGQSLQFSDDAYQHNVTIQVAACVADGIFCDTGIVKDLLISQGINHNKIVVVPLVLQPELEIYGRTNIISKTLFFIGDLYYLPNELAATTLATEILPKVRRAIPETQLLIIGEGPQDLLETLRNTGATCTGPIDNLDTVLKEVTVLAAPIAAGKDVKSKLILALTNGIPAITTSAGASGLVEQAGVIVEDDLDRFAMRIIELFRDEDKLLKISSVAREVAAREYSVSKQVDMLNKIILQAIKSANSVDWEERQRELSTKLKDLDVTHWYGDEFTPAWLETEYRRGRPRLKAGADDFHTLYRVDKSGITKITI